MSAVDDYKALLANYPKGQYIIDTLDISHPLLSRQYYLTSNTDSVTALLEDASEVTFIPTQIEFKLNDTSEDLDQDFGFTFADLNNVWDDELDRIPLDDTTPIQLIYRSYVSTNLTEPSLVYRLQVLDVSQSNGSITLQCGVNQLNWRQTGEVYSFDRFPMLRGLV